MIRPRVASPRAADSWQDEGMHFFVFQLRPEHGSDAAEPPVVVFAMHPEEPLPVSAVVVTPRSDGQTAQITDLRQADRSYVAPFTT